MAHPHVNPSPGRPTRRWPRGVPRVLLTAGALLMAVAAAAPPVAPAAPPAATKSALPPRSATSPVSANQVSPDQIDAAIQRGVAFLYAQQTPHGQWEKSPVRLSKGGHDHDAMQGDTYGGYTALCTFALLEAGEKATDPRVAKALKFLKTADVYGPYSLGLRCMVWAKLANNPEARQLMQDDANRLMGGMLRQGDATGLWDYDSGLPGQPIDRQGSIDRSASQFAVLGLWAAAQAGAAVPADAWRLFDGVWRKGQGPDGAWSYGYTAGGGGGSVSMTAAGIATLLIVQDVLGSLGQPLPAGGTDDHLNKGMTRLALSFDQVAPGGNYVWYGVERISTAGGFRYIGRHDWYRSAANVLVPTQQPDGSWATAGTTGSTPLSETALGVLALSHGRAPVLLGKLNYSAAAEGIDAKAPWHRRPRDAGNLTRYVAHQLEQQFNWQIVSFAGEVEDMLEVPVLLVTGANEVVLTLPERQKLRAYIDGGGMILATTEAVPKAGGALGTDEFSRSILTLAKRLYPTRAFRELPVTHPIYTDQQFRPTRWAATRPVMWGLSNGVRELFVLLPAGDFGKTWQGNKPAAEPAKWELGADVCQYATSRLPRPPKGFSHVIKAQQWDDPATRPVPPPGATGAAAATQPGEAAQPAAAAQVPLPPGGRFLTVGRLRVGDNWDPEPGAWPRVINLVANEQRVFADARPVDADAAQLADVDLLHWTGTTAVKLTAAQRAALAEFTAKGGTLLVDAAGGAAAFADSAQAELNAVFGQTGKEFGAVLPADDPVFRVRGGRIDKVAYRRYLTPRATGKLDAPRLRGLDRGGRTVAYFSREDLTAGCVGQDTDGILGYAPKSATAIVRNVAVLAARRR
jgi:hypothetical protein